MATASSAKPASAQWRKTRFALFRPTTEPLVLPLRHADNQTVGRLRPLALTRPPRVPVGQRGEAQHAGFLRARLRQPGDAEPSRIDIDVAGRAGAFAAAIGVDAGDVVV